MRQKLRSEEGREIYKKRLYTVEPVIGHMKWNRSRIIPHSLFADIDLLLELGYPPDANKSILRQKDLAPKIAAWREQAYPSFIKEILFWTELGYTLSEISALLVRIYKEQSGGGSLAAEDRKQRRERLKATLTRLRDDKVESEELHRLAQSTLSELKRVL